MCKVHWGCLSLYLSLSRVSVGPLVVGALGCAGVSEEVSQRDASGYFNALSPHLHAPAPMMMMTAATGHSKEQQQQQHQKW